MFKAQSLSCRRGKRLVFRDINFALEAGGLLVVKGRNGSGKSSLLRVLAGLLPACEGTLFWCDTPLLSSSDHRARLRYLGHLDAIKSELTVSENIAYWRCLLGTDASLDLEQFGLSANADFPVRYLSAGQKRRLALARLKFGDAPLWLLDEPATALDDRGQKLLLNMLNSHRAKGGMAIVAAHQLDFFNATQELSLDEVA